MKLTEGLGVRLTSTLFRYTPIIASGSEFSTVMSGLSPNSWWRYGEDSGTTATDEQGNADGTYVGTPTLDQTGLIADDANTAVLFNGSSQYVNHGTAAAVEFSRRGRCKVGAFGPGIRLRRLPARRGGLSGKGR